MADVTTYDGIVNALSNNNFGQQTIYEYSPATTTVMLTTGASGTGCRDTAMTKVLPSLPGSITKYRLLYVTANTGNAGPIQSSFLVAKAVLLGTVDVSVTTGGFTDGSAMPTRTELGTANSQTYGPMLGVVTTTLGGTQGAVTVTYTNAAGATGQTYGFTPANTSSAGQGNIFYMLGTTGMQDITNVTRAGGTAPTGIIRFYGLLPLGMFTTGGASMAHGLNLLTGTFNFMELGAANQIKMLMIGGTTTLGSITSTVGEMFFMGES